MKKSVNSRDVLKALRKAGWHEVNQVGSHKQFRHEIFKGRVTVPHPKKEMHEQTLKSIISQMQITEDEFFALID